MSHISAGVWRLINVPLKSIIRGILWWHREPLWSFPLASLLPAYSSFSKNTPDALLPSNTLMGNSSVNRHICISKIVQWHVFLWCKGNTALARLVYSQCCADVTECKSVTAALSTLIFGGKQWITWSSNLWMFFSTETALLMWTIDANVKGKRFYNTSNMKVGE